MKRAFPIYMIAAFILLALFSLATPCFAADIAWTVIYDQDRQCINITASDTYPADANVKMNITWEDLSSSQWYTTKVIDSGDNPATATIIPNGAANGNQYIVEAYLTKNGQTIDGTSQYSTITWGDSNSGTASGTTNGAPVPQAPYNPQGGVFIKLIASVVDGATDVITWAADSCLGSTTLGVLIFNNGLSTADKLYAPFTAAMMDTIWTWYKAIAVGSFVLVMIAVMVTAFKFTASPFNTALREDAVASMWRWLCAVIIIAGAPILFYALVRINNGLVDLFLAISIKVAPGKSLDVMLQSGASPQTGYVLADSIVKLIFSFIRFWLVILYTLRRFVLTVILIFTPIMAWLWSLNKNVNAVQVWLGEILSNLFMQSAHAFVFLILLSLINVGVSGGAPAPAGDYNALYQSLADLLFSYGVPIGGAILFASVCWVAMQIVASRFNPGRREGAVGNLLYVGAGGIILGGVIFFASLTLGIAQNYFPSVFK